MDEEIFELTLWVLAAKDLLAENPALRFEFGSLIDLVDWMKYQATKLCRSASLSELGGRW